MTATQRTAGLALSLALALALAACHSDKGTQGLLGAIPADADFAAVGNTKAIVESAGGTVQGARVSLPSYATDAMPEEKRDDYLRFRAWLEQSGVNAEACAMALMSYDDPVPVYVFTLIDEEAFTKAIQETGYRETSRSRNTIHYSKMVYRSPYGRSHDCYGHMAIRDGRAYWVESLWAGASFDPAEAVERMADGARKKSLASTPMGRYMAQGNAGGAMFRLPEEVVSELRQAGVPTEACGMEGGSLCLKGDLDTSEAKVSLRWFDGNDKEKKSMAMGRYIDLNAKVNADALRYTDKDECLLAAVSAKGVDWNAVADLIAGMTGMSHAGRAAMSMAMPYLRKVDGTVAISAGPVNGMESLLRMAGGGNALDELALTAVAEVSPGQAKELVDDIRNLLLTLDAPFDDGQDGIALTIPGAGTLRMEAKGDILVVSNRAIREDGGNAVAGKVPFADNVAAAGLTLPKNHQLVRDLGVDYGVSLSFTTGSGTLKPTFTLALDGDDKLGVVGRLIKTALALQSNQERIERQFADAIYGSALNHDDHEDDDELPW